MKVSQYFFPTLRETPAEAQIISHRLMLRAGMIQQISSGIYAWLPLGLRVLQKVEKIVREEQNRIGYVEILAPTIQPSDLWKVSGRYDDYGKEMLRFLDRRDRELIYGPTAEEVFTEIFRTFTKSYRDLPVHIYNIQWKFRDEIRPRFGVMRGREFLMKDAYSFDLSRDAAHKAYRDMFEAYIRTFKRMELCAIPITADSGPIGGDLNHEFHVLSDTGEGTIYYDDRVLSAGDVFDNYKDIYAVVEERHDPKRCPISEAHLRTGRGVEVGHVFYFGTKYSVPMGAVVTSREGNSIPIEMGSYGIGVSRLVGALIEVFHDDRGIIWPVSVAPFTVAIATLSESDACKVVAEGLYEQLQARGVDVLYDDRDERAGVKFADLDLIGIPYQILIGTAGVKAGTVEVKFRKTGEIKVLHTDGAVSYLQEKLCVSSC